MISIAVFLTGSDAGFVGSGTGIAGAVEGILGCASSDKEAAAESILVVVGTTLAAGSDVRSEEAAGGADGARGFVRDSAPEK